MDSFNWNWHNKNIMENKIRTVHEIQTSKPILDEDNLHPDIVYFLFRSGLYLYGNHGFDADKIALDDCHKKGLDVMKIITYLFCCESVDWDSNRKDKLFELQKFYLNKIKSKK
jgi:hypothetical protein